MAEIDPDQLREMMKDILAEGEREKAAQAAAPTEQPQPTQPQPTSFREILERIDPRDSDSALLMLDYLMHTGRLHRVGVLDGGQGYMYIYQEPKGASRQGYAPGSTAGDRIVNTALDKQREAGVTPKGKQGMCSKCFEIVHEAADGIRSEKGENPLVCAADGQTHDLA